MGTWLTPNVSVISWNARVRFFRPTAIPKWFPPDRTAGPPIDHAFQDALRVIDGAYALLLMTEKQMIAAQDPRGFRPLSLGQFENAWVVSSETCALNTIGADFVREIKPGELLVFDEKGLQMRPLRGANQENLLL